MKKAKYMEELLKFKKTIPRKGTETQMTRTLHMNRPQYLRRQFPARGRKRNSL